MMEHKQDLPAAKNPGIGNPFLGFIMALQFLTVTPDFLRRIFTPLELGQATAFFPLAGFVLGLALLGANELLIRLFLAPVTAGLVLALWVVLTGALHLDGFLDTCDGLLGGSMPESRLEIMKDERVGAFALAGGVLLLLLKFAALASLPSRSFALLVAPVSGRLGMTLAIFAYPYARREGLGRAMKDNTGVWQVIMAGMTALVVAWLSAGWLGLFSIGLAFLMVWLGASFTLRRIPGLTGDIYGALNELIELVVLLAFLAVAR